MEEGSGKEETGEHCEATEHVLSRGSNYTARCIPCCLWRLGCKSDGREPATAPLTFDWFVPQTWSTSLCKAVKVMCFTASSFLLRLMKQEIISLPSWHIPDHKLQSHPCFCTTLVQFPLYSQESIQANWYERTRGEINVPIIQQASLYTNERWQLAVYSGTLEFSSIQTSAWTASGDLSLQWSLSVAAGSSLVSYNVRIRKGLWCTIYYQRHIYRAWQERILEKIQW